MSIRPASLIRRAILLAAAGASVSCSSGSGNSGGTAPVIPVLTTINVSISNSAVTVGSTVSATASGFDQNGAAIALGIISWSTSPATIASITSSGVVTGLVAGSTSVTATVGAKQGSASLSVLAPAPVATITLSATTLNMIVGATQAIAATVRDAANNILSGRVVTWSTSAAGVATVSTSGVITAVGVGVATITATSEGKTATVAVTVANSAAQLCSSSSALQLSVGQVVTLTAAQTASLCLGGTAAASEYVLIPFNNSNVSANIVPVTVTGSNTTAILTPPLASLQAMSGGARFDRTAGTARVPSDWAFRVRERQDLSPALSRGGPVKPNYLTNVNPTPAVGSVIQINANLTGNTCTSAKQLHPARVAAVLPHTIVLIDTLAPAGGYTDAELAGFGADFDTLGYALDTLNFGAPSDIDSNGRVAIFFTQGVNQIPGPPGGIILGLQASRDLFFVTSCVASNEGEMFYLPVPDPNQTLNGNYKSKASLANGVLPTLVHEFQHLINAGRRIYVNNAQSFEEVWLNEGLSHIAEELLYYRESGNSPRTNINLANLRSTQAQVNAINTYQIQNLSRLISYMTAPETNSPFALNDNLPTRGAIWQLLRYAADRKGGLERSNWSAMVNSTTSGQINFNAIFGDIITLSRDWAVAQFLDDAGLNAAANYTNPSWNFRSILPAINNAVFPLLTHSLISTPVSVSLNGGGAAYVRFRVESSIFANVGSTSSGQPVPSSVDFILVRTQ